MTRIHIGFDSSLIEEGVTADNARVYVEANNGEVSITCAWGDAWAGYAAMYDGSPDAADLLARAVAADPVGVLEAMSYSCGGWFKAA